MNEVDGIAFLSGDSRFRVNKRAFYEPLSMVDRVRRVIVSPKKACCIALFILVCILAISLIAAFARPLVSCTCSSREQNPGLGLPALVDANLTTIPAYRPLSTSGEPFPWDVIRLPQFIVPQSYAIALRPNLTTFTNHGTVNLTFTLRESHKFVLLHVKDLELSNFQLETTDAKDLAAVRKILIYPKHEQLYVEFSTTLSTKVAYSLSIDFKGNLSEKLEGFYLSSYHTSTGEKRYIATTHFEPTYARMAFPCFDEPSLKATFRVSIVREARHVALFNMPIAQTKKLGENLFIDYFDETVRMSTYLVAFVICDYRSITKMTSTNITVSVYSSAEQIHQASFALEVAASVLGFYDDFFGIPYPLPKQDLIAIPDFGAGAMENWGLTTYRETAILTDFGETSVAKMQQVALTITHELAHQWFGDLVTMSWWNDLWLNEGFASFIENLGTEFVRPEWSMMDQFVITKTQPALHLDALASSHPISVHVDDPSDIESIFDAISYNKGAAIIYMLESFLGKAILRQGLHTYLNSFQYTNAKTEQLWHVLSRESKAMNASVDVEAIMDTWTQQMGFPLVTVERKGNAISARQQRFLVGSSAEEDGVNSEFISKYGYKWYVPLTYTTDKSSLPQLVWLNLGDAQFPIPGDVNWIKFNTNQTGFYRVNYDDQTWHTLIAALASDHTAFSAADRASLLDDAFTLARNNMLDPTIPLQMTRYLLVEKDYTPWTTALESFVDMEITLRESPALLRFKKYVQSILMPIVKEVGWEDEGSHLQRLLRPSVLLAAARYGNSVVIDKALRTFRDWQQNGTRVAPALRSIVYAVGIEHGNDDDWKHCWDYFSRTQVPSEKAVLLAALGESRNPWLLSQYLQHSIQREKIRPQNTFMVIKVVSHNPIGRDLTWLFIRSNWRKLIDLFGLGSFALSSIITDTTDQFHTEFEYREVKSFFEVHEVGSGKRAVRTALEKIRSKIQWLQKNEKIVEEWLQANSSL